MRQLLLAILCACLLSCQKDGGFFVVPDRIEASLPPNAQNIKLLGNGWAEFDLNGRHFLYRRSEFDRSASDCITVLP